MALSNLRPMPQVLESIVSNVQDIIRSEVRLAKAETVEEATAAGRAMAVLGAGLILATAALGFALLAAVYALSRIVDPWLAALIVSAGAAVVGIALLWGGIKRLKSVHFGPEKTVRSIKETVQWVKHPSK